MHTYGIVYICNYMPMYLSIIRIPITHIICVYYFKRNKRHIHEKEGKNQENIGLNLDDLLKLTPKRDALFITRDWKAKVGSQVTPRQIGKFCLGEQNEGGQRLTEFFQENALVMGNTLFQQHKR